MNEKISLAVFSLAVMVSLGLLLSPLATAAEGAGKAVFDDQKCSLCHAVSSLGIEATTKSEKLKGPDLDGVGDRFEGEWLGKYLKKEVDKEGKAHTKPFKGNDEELQALVDWLLELKASG